MKSNMEERSGFLECMDDVEPGGRADEGIVEILMGFFDQLLGFPVTHTRGQEEWLERWKHAVIIHPRQLPNA
jgi:hypothetical protein